MAKKICRYCGLTLNKNSAAEKNCASRYDERGLEVRRPAASKPKERKPR